MVWLLAVLSSCFQQALAVRWKFLVSRGKFPFVRLTEASVGREASKPHSEIKLIAIISNHSRLGPPCWQEKKDIIVYFLPARGDFYTLFDVDSSTRPNHPLLFPCAEELVEPKPNWMKSPGQKSTMRPSHLIYRPVRCTRLTEVLASYWHHSPK